MAAQTSVFTVDRLTELDWSTPECASDEAELCTECSSALAPAEQAAEMSTNA